MTITSTRHPDGSFTIISEHLEGDISPHPVHNRCYTADWFYIEKTGENSRKVYTDAKPGRNIPRKELIGFLREMRKCMDQLFNEECGVFMTTELHDYQAESRLSLYLRAGFKPAPKCFREFGYYQYWGRKSEENNV